MTDTQAPLAPAEVAGRMPERPRPAAAGQLGSLSRAMLRSSFRDKTSLFFTFPFRWCSSSSSDPCSAATGASTTSLGVVGDGPVISALPGEVVDAVPTTASRRPWPRSRPVTCPGRWSSRAVR